MEHVSFIIPKNIHTNKKDLSINLNIEKIKNKNANEYTQIVQNVYKFNTVSLSIEKDIYMLFNIACQIKKEDVLNAIDIFKKCKKLINDNTLIDVKYEIFINLALLVSEINGSISEVNNYFKEALDIYPDRAEPYYYWSIYCNKNKNFNKAYELLKHAILFSYEESKKKYSNTQITSYGKYLYDELAVTCYWLTLYDEAKTLLEKIIDDPDYYNHKERLSRNLELTNKEILKNKE
jgi:tetratricopeptide (TPR) repeat protein